jgi:hypothetical protein
MKDPRSEAFRAVSRGNVATLRKVLEAHPEVLRNDAEYLIGNAVCSERMDVLKYLVSMGARANWSSWLIGAAACDCPKAAEWLLARGADVNYCDVDNFCDVTPLLRAVREDHLRMVQLLIKRGANPATLTNDKGYLPPMNAAQLARHFKRHKIAKWLAAQGIVAADSPVNGKVAEPQTPSAWYEATFFPLIGKGNRSLAKLKKKERTIFLVGSLIDEVNNGGAAQYFANPTGVRAAAAAEALDSIGATQLGKALRAATACFPNGQPAKNREQREEQIEKLNSKAHAKFAALDRELAKRKKGELVVVRLLFDACQE